MISVKLILDDVGHRAGYVFLEKCGRDTHAPVRKEEGVIDPLVWNNLSWAGWVMEGLISIGTQVLFIPSHRG